VSAPPGTFGNFSGVLFTPGGVANPGAWSLEQLIVPPGQARVYRNDGGVFADVTGALGLTPAANPRSVSWVDFDNDGDLDLHQVNKGTVEVGNEGDTLWRNDGATFAPLQGAGWVPGDADHLGDGGVWGDLDGDGDLDLFLQEGAGPAFFNSLAQPTFYRNEGPAGGWLSMTLGQTAAGGTSVGARVTCHAGSLAVHRQARADCWRGFQRPLSLHFGLGSESVVDSLVIEWPGGGMQVLGPMPANRSLRLSEGDALQFAASVEVLTASPDSIVPNQPGSLVLEVRDSMGDRLSGERFNLTLESLAGLIAPGTPAENPDSTYTFSYSSLANVGLDSLVVTDVFPEPPVSDTLLVQVSHFPDHVTIAPEFPRVHWNGSADLRASIRNAAGNRIPDEGTPFAVTSLLGYGTIGAPSAESDSSYTLSYLAGFMTGTLFDEIEIFDPEATTADRDTTLLEVTDASIIDSVLDVANDQGRQVRVIWQRDLHDTTGSSVPIAKYIVWRRVDDPVQAGGKEVIPASHLDATSLEEMRGGGSVLEARGDLWEPVGPVVPAMLWDHYASVVPTLVDSTASEGVQFTAFLISAHTLDSGVFFFSAPDSGFSSDNLIPSVPVSIRLDGTTLRWEKSPDSDFDFFTVYGALLPEFDGAERIGSTAETAFDISGAPYGWYFVTASDSAGNESNPALVENLSTSTPENGRPPSRFRLGATTPNPFEASTRISFDLPRPAHVRLAIYDVTGRLVRTIVRETLPAGRHHARWAGQVERGQLASNGVYFVRLEAGTYSATRKIVRLK
jgi:hypothetical protein